MRRLAWPLALAAALFAERALAACATASTHKPPDTPCAGQWPDYEGPIDIPVRFAVGNDNPEYRNYGDIKACVYYEVCSDKLDKYVDRAAECCDAVQETGLTANCREARSSSGRDRKECLGRYLVRVAGQGGVRDRGSGGAAGFEGVTYYAHAGAACCASGHYPEWQWWCKALTDGENDAQKARFIGTCGSRFPAADRVHPLHAVFASMPCSGVPPDPRMRPGVDVRSQSCVSLLFPPTSMNAETLRLGGCTSDTGVLTTLLRKAGYSKSETMGVSSNFHYFTILKLPRSGWTLAEDDAWCDSPWVQCTNDSGVVPCPAKSAFAACRGHAGGGGACPSGCSWGSACHPVGTEACVGGEKLRCTGNNLIENLGRCCPTGCLYSGQCYVEGQTDCVGGVEYRCAGPNRIERLGACRDRPRPCPNGCRYDGDCVDVGAQRCVNGKNFQCDPGGQVRQVGLCCPGGCLYNARCYRPGETECVDRNLWRCDGEDRKRIIGRCGS